MSASDSRIHRIDPNVVGAIHHGTSRPSRGLSVRLSVCPPEPSIRSSGRAQLQSFSFRLHLLYWPSILGEMDNFYTIVDSIGEGILSWADPDMKYSGYTKVGFFI
jgi:hypothetical protein